MRSCIDSVGILSGPRQGGLGRRASSWSSGVGTEGSASNNRNLSVSTLPQIHSCYIRAALYGDTPRVPNAHMASSTVPDRDVLEDLRLSVDSWIRPRLRDRTGHHHLRHGQGVGVWGSPHERRSRSFRLVGSLDEDGHTGWPPKHPIIFRPSLLRYFILRRYMDRWGHIDLMSQKPRQRMPR